MIIDIHTHTFPEKIASRAVSSLEATSFLKPALGGTLHELCTSMQKYGIDYSVLQPIATLPRQVEACNDAAIENSKLPGIISFGAMHPAYESIEAELERIAQAGLRGIKLHPDFQGAYIDSPAMLRILKAAARLGLIVMLHGGADISYPEINKCTPERVARVMDVLGDAKIICAHLGGFGYLRQSIRCLAGGTVYIDTSAVDGIFPDEEIARVVEAFTPERVMMGSDSPWEKQGDAVALIYRLNLSESDREKVLSQNAAKLLGLN